MHFAFWRGATDHRRSKGVGNPNSAAGLHRAGKGSGALRETVSANADQNPTDLAPVLADIRAEGI